MSIGSFASAAATFAMDKHGRERPHFNRREAGDPFMQLPDHAVTVLALPRKTHMNPGSDMMKNQKH